MNKYLLLLLVLLCCASNSIAQDDDECNALGVWLWRFENTGQPSHTNLARTLSFVGAKRIYIKVADGGFNADNWPTLADEELIQDYLDEDVQPWAWSYNYQGNYAAQAKALYLAAKTGYQGFVIDIEIEFNGESDELEKLMQAFFIEKQRAISDGYADHDFKLYVTTWGNPITHNYRIDIIDKYVDGYMPQTYIEEWAGDHLTMIENCISESKLEYESLGATKPLHNIVSTAQEIMTADEITHFFQLSGPEASLWRVPGGGVPQDVWTRWYDVDWDMNFCNQVSTIAVDNLSISIFPNPTSDFLQIDCNGVNIEKVEIYRQDGVIVKQVRDNLESVDVHNLAVGMYYIILYHHGIPMHKRFVKS